MGAGTTFEEQDYYFLHQHPTPGNNYYRLKQRDFDGRSEESEIVSVRIGDNDPQVQIFPNPIQNGELNLLLPQMENMEATVSLYDGFGRPALNRKLNEGQNTLSIDFLSAGIYHVEVQLNQQRIRKRIVIYK